MKKLLTILSALLLALAFSVSVYAEDDLGEDIYSSVGGIDIDDVKDDLSDLGIDPDEPETVENLNPQSAVSYIKKLFMSALKGPVKMILTVLVFAAICSVSQTLSFKAGVYGELFVLVCFISLSGRAVEAFSFGVGAVKGASGFMLSYIPIFGSIAAASGNLSAAVSYNAILLYFCEAAALAASGILRPLLCSMLVLSAAQALSPELAGITSAIKNAVTTLLGFVMTMFLGIIGLQSAVGRTAEGLAVRAGKYAVSSFVPVIGYSLSESYRTVSLSLSAIRTAVGAFGVVIICLFMLSPIISALVYKTAFILCGWICRLTGAERLCGLMYGLADVFSFLSTVLIFFMLMLTVATGMLILLGGTLLT